MVLRLTSNGLLDNTFGTSGKAQIAFTEDVEGIGIAINPVTTNIVFAGASKTPASAFTGGFIGVLFQ